MANFIYEKQKLIFYITICIFYKAFYFFVEKCDNMSIKLKQKRNPSNYQWCYLKAGRNKMDFYLIYKNNLESIH